MAGHVKEERKNIKNNFYFSCHHHWFRLCRIYLLCSHIFLFASVSKHLNVFFFMFFSFNLVFSLWYRTPVRSFTCVFFQFSLSGRSELYSIHQTPPMHEFYFEIYSKIRFPIQIFVFRRKFTCKPMDMLKMMYITIGDAINSFKFGIMLFYLFSSYSDRARPN